jgi:hypothetical protein
MNFYSSYLDLLKKLPPSIKKNIWNRLISRLHNPLTEEQASSIDPDIEILLISEIDKYEKKKSRYRINSKVNVCSRDTGFLPKTHKNSIVNSSPIQNTEISQTNICSDTSSTIEEEINIRVKEATNLMHQEFVESTRKQLESIKLQSDIRCEQVKQDMANRSRDLFDSTLKKYIRDGSIYTLIHDLKVMDGKNYSSLWLQSDSKADL